MPADRAAAPLTATQQALARAIASAIVRRLPAISSAGDVPVPVSVSPPRDGGRAALGLATHIEEAFIYEKTIDQAVYAKQRDRIQEEFTITEIELHDARIDSLDIEGVLAFAEHLIANVRRIWMEATLDQRQRIQAAIFPEGIPFDGREFGTATTCIAFNRIGGLASQNIGLASPICASWNQLKGWLRAVEGIRRVA